MISLSESQSSRPGEVPAFLLSVALVGIKPSIKRDIVVPASANLGWLHAVLQISMGWTNSHLHQFMSGTQCYSDPSFDLDDPGVADERKCSVSKLLTKPGAILRYEYDFGDSWSHFITLKEISTTPFIKSARCIDGAGACPPEDCGGIPGYMNLVEAFKKPASKAAKEFQKWLGHPYDATAFNHDSVNPWLTRLPWPNVSTSALGKIIAARVKSGR